MNKKQFTYFSIYIKELKLNLILYLFLFTIISTICYFNHNQILYLFIKPFLNNGKYLNNITNHFILTHITEALYIKILVSCFCSLLISIPFVFIHLWTFLFKGFYKHENICILKKLLYLSINYIISIYIYYYYILPNATNFFLSFQGLENNNFFNIYLEPRLENYIKFVITFALYVIIFLHIPILFTYKKLFEIIKTFKKLVYVIILIIATIITPPDIYSQLLFSIPLILLIEFIIFFKILYNNYKKYKAE